MAFWSSGSSWRYSSCIEYTMLLCYSRFWFIFDYSYHCVYRDRFRNYALLIGRLRSFFHSFIWVLNFACSVGFLLKGHRWRHCAINKFRFSSWVRCSCIFLVFSISLSSSILLRTSAFATFDHLDQYRPSNSFSDGIHQAIFLSCLVLGRPRVRFVRGAITTLGYVPGFPAAAISWAIGIAIEYSLNAAAHHFAVYMSLKGLDFTPWLDGITLSTAKICWHLQQFL